MITKKTKKLPYGKADFKSIRTGDNFVYVDKTRFIEFLEKENNSSKIFIRPRRFGKSLFLSMLSYYYDVNYEDEFDQLFGDLCIGKNPTPLKNSYAVMEFDFSGINTSSIEAFQNSFEENIRRTTWRSGSFRCFAAWCTAWLGYQRVEMSTPGPGLAGRRGCMGKKKQRIA